MNPRMHRTPEQLRLNSRPWRPGHYVTESGNVLFPKYTPDFLERAQQTTALINAILRKVKP